MKAIDGAPDTSTGGRGNQRVLSDKFLALGLVVVGLFGTFGPSTDVAMAQIAAIHSTDPLSVANDILDREFAPRFYFNPSADAVAIIRAIPLRSTLNNIGAEPVNALSIAFAPKWRLTQLSRRGRIIGHLAEPKWSPDGIHLAFIRAHGRALDIEVWDAHKHKRVYTSKCFVAPFAEGNDTPDVYYAWTDSVHIVTWAQPSECMVGDSLTLPVPTTDIPDAVDDWRTAVAKPGPHVSVVSVGSDSDARSFPRTDVWFIDVLRGKHRIVARGSFLSAVLSPDGHLLAVLDRTSFAVPRTQSALLALASYFRTRLGVIDLRSSRPPIWIAPSSSILPTTLAWSPNGLTLAAVEHDWQVDGSRSCAVVYSVRDSATTSSTCGELGSKSWATDARYLSDDIDLDNPAVSSLRWLGDGRLSVLMRTAKDTNSERADWFIIADSGRRINLTNGLSGVPQSFTIAGRRTFFAADGAAWEVGEGTPARARVALPETPDSVVGITDARSAGHDVVLRVATAAAGTRREVDVRLGTRSTMRLVARGWDSSATNGSRSSAWVAPERGEADSSSYILFDSRSRTRHRLVTIPGFARGEQLEERMLSFESLTNSQRVAKLLLPLGYDSTRRYPTIVSVYPTYGATRRLPADSVGSRRSYRISKFAYASASERLALHGFAVMSVQIALSDTAGVAGTILSESADDVLPAVDKVIRIGVADSTRLGLIGRSAGGYSVYGLLAFTTRFRAAVALAGPANLASLYGSIASLRHYPAGPFALFWLFSFETGQFSMGGPPWTRPMTYVKNSPFYSVDRIKTPVMIVQGDQDFVPLDQGETMFEALVRNGQPVELVRYWGEGHAILSYYNQVDLESKIRAWFDSHLITTNRPTSEPNKPAS